MEKLAITAWQKALPSLSDGAIESLHALGDGRGVLDFHQRTVEEWRESLSSRSRDRFIRHLSDIDSFRAHMRRIPKQYTLSERHELYDKLAPGVVGTRGYFPSDPHAIPGSHGRLLVHQNAMDEPLTLYHGTDAKHMPTIAEQGLRVTEDRRNSDLARKGSPAYDAWQRVFLTPDRKAAERYVSMPAWRSGDRKIDEVHGAVATVRMTPRELLSHGALSIDGRTGERELAVRHVPPDKVSIEPHLSRLADHQYVTKITFDGGKRFENGRYAPID